VLIALGPAVREAPHAADARLVAEETMRRVAANVDEVIRRLKSRGYRFRTPSGARIPPGVQTAKLLRELDDLAGPVPFSLAAFYGIVGSIDLTGYHDSITSNFGGYYLPDPLVVFPLDQVLREYHEATEADFGRIVLAPDAYHKAELSGGAPYEVKLPDPCADGKLLNERHDLYFVEYLRLAFRHAGFPGYDGMERLPGIVRILSLELQPF